MKLKKKKKPLKLLSLFSGIGAFEKALDNLNISYQLINYCEVDKFASKAYSLIHNCPENLNLGDITKIDEKLLPKDIDLVTYGFPCQDISVAGKRKGLIDENNQKTRSGLFFDAVRIIKHCRPKIAIAENVKNLTSKSMSDTLDTVLKSLEDVGYNNYYKVLKATDFGIPQMRERVFIVSVRKDIDKEDFEFPEPVELTKTLKDFISKEVPEKYVLTPKQVRYVRHAKFNEDRKCIQDLNGVCRTLKASDYRRFTAIPYYGESVGKFKKQKYRKLTPLEYLKLMGFTEDDYSKLSEFSDSQIYKMTGNSIVVSVLEALFKNLYKRYHCYGKSYDFN